MTSSRVVRWAGSTNSPSARDYFSVIDEKNDAQAAKARKAFLRAVVRQEEAVPFPAKRTTSSQDCG